ncbi:MAG: acyl-CoA dehydrogenase family protein, partial [Lentisphaeria bacterium]|nr:acyl-CoA dehydrogenase family protein [Lentisphaeria bacterium]NQZ70720.1 acyl-CoA dehydrogenase family protein [Lentisphaeria bacterium]
MYGLLMVEPLYYTIPAVVALVVIFGYNGAPLWLWTILVLGILAGFAAPVPLIIGVAVLLLLFVAVPLRRVIVTANLMKMLKEMGILPSISKTERIAIDAGTVWVDKELFSGKPDFKRMMSEAYPELTDDERAFIDGPVNEICSLTNDWEAFCTHDLPEEVWEKLKAYKFFGMIIPKSYGGLEFSALANSTVVTKLASRSMPLAVNVMVPNSLGPAELLIHYGTEKQKDYYLPRLADGREIPCFALTEPTAGSDAGAISASGLVFKDDDGELKIRMNWQKRYISLAAVST